FVAFACVTFAYTLHWTDQVTLFRHSLRSTPGSVRLRIALSSLHRDRGELDAAAAVIDDGLVRIGECWEMWAMGAEIAALRGEFDVAEQRLARAWELVPERSYGYVGMIATRVRHLQAERGGK